MKYAADFRRIARDALRGKWFLAVLAGLVASLLGGASFEGPDITLHVDPNGVQAGLQIAGQTVYTTRGEFAPALRTFLMGGVLYVIAVLVVLAVLYFILGSVISVGYARFNLRLLDRDAPPFESLFAYFPYWRTAAAAGLLQSLYILLWSLLLIVPGIMAAYSYSMTSFILAEYPELTAREAIARSKELMYGNRWRLFCLQLSFIGWSLLCTLTMGIGNLWLTPYTHAATAAFYREISGPIFVD